MEDRKPLHCPPPPVPMEAGGEPDKAIRLVNDKTGRRIDIVPGNPDGDGIGIWLTDGKLQQCISIYIVDGQFAVGVYGNLKKANACAIAIHADENNVGHLQMVGKDGKVRQFTAEDLEHK